MGNSFKNSNGNSVVVDDTWSVAIPDGCSYRTNRDGTALNMSGEPYLLQIQSSHDADFDDPYCADVSITVRKQRLSVYIESVTSGEDAEYIRNFLNNPAVMVAIGNTEQVFCNEEVAIYKRDIRVYEYDDGEDIIRESGFLLFLPHKDYLYDCIIRICTDNDGLCEAFTKRLINSISPISEATKQTQKITGMKRKLPVYIESKECVIHYTGELRKYMGGYSDDNIEDHIILPPNTKIIGEDAFCMAPVKSIVIPVGVTKICDKAFQMSKIEFVYIPETVTEIGEEAFYSCDNLREIIIPRGVKNLGEWCFHSCDQLTDVYIPETVTEIGFSAFGLCARLTAHVVRGSYAEAYCIEDDIKYDYAEAPEYENP